VAPEVAVRFRRILVLLVLVAALGTYLYVYELPQAEKEGKKDKLLGVGKDAVTGIVLTYPDREIALQKGDKGWRLTKPVDAPADETAVGGLLSTLLDAEVQKTLDEAPADPAAFGLDKPSPTVRLTVTSGEAPPPITVGKTTTIGAKTYVRKDDEPKVYLTASSLRFGLNKQAKDLRDKEILRFQDDDVQRVEITADDGRTTTLVRKDKDSWTLEPGGLVADVTEARSYLSSLRSTRAVDFPDDAPADLGRYGLSTPRLTVTVATGKDGAETQTLLLGGERTEGSQKQVYAKRASTPTVYALGEWSLRTLGKTAAQLRDKTVLGFDTARVGEVAIERKDGGTVQLARAEGGWRVASADGKKPNEGAITRFLDDLRELRGSDIAAEPATDKQIAAYGLAAPDLRVALTDKDGQAMGTILAAKQGDKRYVMQAGSQTVFEARDYMYARLDKRPADFVEPDAAATATTLPGPADADEADEPDDWGEDDEAGADEE
jgi:hypothetical protein